MSMLEDFKTFALRGNIVELAIGFTVGAAFTTVVKSLVSDVLMPPLGLATGGADFADLFAVLKVPEGVAVPEEGFPTLAAAQQVGAVTLNYGLFLNSCLALLIIAVAMFVAMRLINKLDAQLDEAFSEPSKEPEEPSEKKCEHCRLTIPYRATRCPNCTSQLAMPSSVASA